MKTFYYDMWLRKEERRTLVNPHPMEVEAKNLGHALQKIAAALPDESVGGEAHEVRVWEKKS